MGVCHKTGEIGHLFVTQSARGSGIGTKLLDFARKKLAEHARPWLAVLDVNTAAIGLYRRMGYLPDGVRNMLCAISPRIQAEPAVFCRFFVQVL